MGRGSVGSKHTAAGAGFVGSIYQSSMATRARCRRRAASMGQRRDSPAASSDAMDESGRQRRRMGIMGPARATTREWWISQSGAPTNVESHDPS